MNNKGPSTEPCGIPDVTCITWLLKFYPEKCKHMNIARVEKTDEFKYKLSGKNIERVQKEKDIGVTIDSELTFESHMNNKGPNTESCGIPDVTSFQSDVDPLIDTLSVLPVRKSSIHSNGLSNT
jgi:hypothetical protein